VKSFVEDLHYRQEPINWPLIPESGKVFNVIENHHKLFLSSSL